MAGPTLRRLEPGDEERLDAYVRATTDTGLFIRNNVRVAGLVDRGERYQGTYVGAFENDELTGVAAHYWNGFLHVEAPLEDVPALAHACLAKSSRQAKGFIGGVARARTAQAAVGLEHARTQLDSMEVLFKLDLADLRVPAALADGVVAARHAEEADRGFLLEWYAAYHCETLGGERGPELAARVRVSVDSLLSERTLWLLIADDSPVASNSFNARLPDVVQVGGVWTPPELRRRGYARSVVAASLIEARAAGVGQAVLFTDQHNLPAIRAYEALGFEAAGDYALIILE